MHIFNKSKAWMWVLCVLSIVQGFANSFEKNSMTVNFLRYLNQVVKQRCFEKMTQLLTAIQKKLEKKDNTKKQKMKFSLFPQDQ